MVGIHEIVQADTQANAGAGDHSFLIPVPNDRFRVQVKVFCAGVGVAGRPAVVPLFRFQGDVFVADPQLYQAAFRDRVVGQRGAGGAGAAAVGAAAGEEQGAGQGERQQGAGVVHRGTSNSLYSLRQSRDLGGSLPSIPSPMTQKGGNPFLLVLYHVFRRLKRASCPALGKY